eukprot:597249-Pyramimonas_sp.AAC.1
MKKKMSWIQCDTVVAGSHYFVERVRKAGNVGLLQPSAPRHPPSSGATFLLGVRSGGCTCAQA